MKTELEHIEAAAERAHNAIRKYAEKNQITRVGTLYGNAIGRLAFQFAARLHEPEEVRAFVQCLLGHVANGAEHADMNITFALTGSDTPELTSNLH